MSWVDRKQQYEYLNKQSLPSFSEVKDWKLADRDYRGIEKETYRKFNVRFGYTAETHDIGESGEYTPSLKYIAFECRRKNTVVGYILRDVTTEEQHKKYITIGEVKPTCELLFANQTDANKKTLYITEGAFDALTLFQMGKGCVNVVSLLLGTTQAKLNIAHNLKFVNAHSTIVTIFDGDRRLDIEDDNIIKGAEATQQVHSLLDYKALNVPMPTDEDINDMYLRGDLDDLKRRLASPEKYTPEFINYEIKPALFTNTGIEDGIDLEFAPILSESIQGVQLQQLIGLLSTKKAGKSTFTLQVYYELLKQGKKVLGLFFENSTKSVQQRLSCLHVNKDYRVLKKMIKEKTQYFTEAEQQSAFNFLKGVGYYDNIAVGDLLKSTMHTIDIAVKTGYNYIILDHLTFVCGQGAEAISNQNTLLQFVKFLIRDYPVGIIIVNHVTEDKSKIASVKKWAREEGHRSYTLNYNSKDSRFGSVLSQIADSTITINPTYSIDDDELMYTTLKLDDHRDDSSMVGYKDVLYLENGRLTNSLM